MSMYDTEILEYVSFRQSTHLNHHRAVINPQDYVTLIPQAMKFVQQELPTSVLDASNDPRLLLELGIRQWTGFGAPQDKPGAAAAWTVLASYREDVPPPLKARAHSSLAKAWYDLAHENAPEKLNIAYLYDAGNSANEAVGLGLISPAVLMVASKIESLGFRRPEDNKSPEHDTERFELLADLWEALDARKAEMAEESSKREAKVSKDPLSYFCAAEDCGIVPTKKSTLRKCAGGCPLVFKPSYCSKYCQKTDWKHHKPFCRPDATESSVHSGDTGTSTTGRQSDPPEDVNSEGFQPGGERTINVNLGGRTVQIASSTIGPQMMRGMREHLEKGF